MLSKILIDVDDQMRPVIRIDYRPSDDLKDKMVKIFLERFDMWASYASLQSISDDNSMITLTPISSGEIESHSEIIKEVIESRVPVKKMTKEEFDLIQNSITSEK